MSEQQVIYRFGFIAFFGALLGIIGAIVFESMTIVIIGLAVFTLFGSLIFLDMAASVFRPLMIAKSWVDRTWNRIFNGKKVFQMSFSIRVFEYNDVAVTAYGSFRSLGKGYFKILPEKT